MNEYKRGQPFNALEDCNDEVAIMWKIFSLGEEITRLLSAESKNNKSPIVCFETNSKKFDFLFSYVLSLFSEALNVFT